MGFATGSVSPRQKRLETYRLFLEAVHAEMQKLGLLPASQWHTDWAPAVLPNVVHVPGMEHMMHNLGKNSMKQMVPRLTGGRGICVVSKYLYLIAELPTLALHVLALQIFLECVRVGWQEPTWEQCSRQQYAYTARVVKADCDVEQATLGRSF